MTNSINFSTLSDTVACGYTFIKFKGLPVAKIEFTWLSDNKSFDVTIKPVIIEYYGRVSIVNWESYKETIKCSSLESALKRFNTWISAFVINLEGESRYFIGNTTFDGKSIILKIVYAKYGTVINVISYGYKKSLNIISHAIDGIATCKLTSSKNQIDGLLAVDIVDVELSLIGKTSMRPKRV